MTLKTGQVPNMGKSTQSLGFPLPIPCVHGLAHGTKLWKRRDTNPYHNSRGITVIMLFLKTFHQSANMLANAVKSSRQVLASGVGVRRMIEVAVAS